MMTRSSTLAAIVLLLIPAVSQAWWNDEWAFRKPITLDQAALGLPALSDPPPVLVRLHPGNFTFFSDVLPEGADIRFVAGDDKTPLKHHIEKFDPLNGMALIWVEAPKAAAASGVTPVAGQIWMYYGNPQAGQGSDSGGTYDRNYALVWHFDEQGAPRDATAHANQTAGFSALPDRAAIIGAGARFDGTGSIQVTPSGSLAISPDQGWSFSAWLRIDAPQHDVYILQAQDGEHALILGVDGAALYVNFDGAAVASATPLTTGTWHHVALAAGTGQLKLYLDGAETGSAAAVLPVSQPAVTVGAAADGGHALVGELDEVTISNVARSAVWISAQMRAQGIEGAPLGYGEDQSRDSGESGSNFTVILQNVTVDGWVVIVLLSIMAAISWIVMAVKGVVIGRMRKDNCTFLQQFRQVSGVTALDANGSAEDKDLEASPFTQALFGKHDHFQSSTLYHLYHTGAHELKARLGTAVGAQASLTPQALDAIRAALDATLVRETQKLNGQMVLLTIAISGGPFLGLLGTVVGVMITFAAIAASGDVNINAIAPGIAAALVATVAGLAVAIPALFGYNYLSSRIKEIGADMRVFVDEYITRLAELHI
jgi:biopolymer transport protein ExbB